MLRNAVECTTALLLFSPALKAAFFFVWTDPRLQWRRQTGIGNWQFPDQRTLPDSRRVGAELPARELPVRQVRREAAGSEEARVDEWRQHPFHDGDGGAFHVQPESQVYVVLLLYCTVLYWRTVRHGYNTRKLVH